MSVRNPMTPEELRNNYEYKVVRRGLMKEFPWITDVFFNEDEINDYNLIFLEIVVDLKKMEEYFGWGIAPYLKDRIERGEKYRAIFPSLILNVSYEEGKSKVTDLIEDMMDAIHKSPALPDELKLPDGRMFRVSAYVVNPDGPEW
jgi:hypothetical protein